MAKKKKQDPTFGQPVKVCKGRDCDTSLPDVAAVRPYEGWHFTSPAAQPAMGRKQRRAIGCEEVQRTRFCFPKANPKTKSGKSRKCYASETEAQRQHSTAGKDALGPVEPSTDNRFTGYLNTDEGQIFDTRCKNTTSKPCGDRASCPVQLAWIDGKPNLRFCNEQGEVGYLVPVEDPAQAVSYAKEACAKWPNKVKGANVWPEKFWEKNAPEVVEDAEEAFPAGGPATALPGLGESMADLFEVDMDALARMPDFDGYDDDPDMALAEDMGEGYQPALPPPDIEAFEQSMDESPLVKLLAVAAVGGVLYWKFRKKPQGE